MSKATIEEMGDLHGAIARGLTEVIKEGTVVGMSEEGEPLKGPASAAYFMAGITMLKNNSITADPSRNADIQGLEAAIAARRRAGKARVSNVREAVAAAQEQLDHMLTGGDMIQ
jgi:hypothetical protein